LIGSTLPDFAANHIPNSAIQEPSLEDVKLFTSEPSVIPRTVHGLTLVGRFAVRRRTSARTAAALASERILPCAQQTVLWNARKLAKRVGGREYLGLRRILLGLGDDVRWGDDGWRERRD
jgi:hypothetical protein